MLVKKETSAKRIIIYVAIIVIMIGANVYYYIASTNDTGEIPVVNNLAAESISAGDSRQLSSEQKSVLEHKLFQELQKTGDWPVIPKKVGRSNPFLPYFEN